MPSLLGLTENSRQAWAIPYISGDKFLKKGAYATIIHIHHTGTAIEVASRHSGF